MMNSINPVDNRTRSWLEGNLVPGVICHICGSSEKVCQGTSESLIGTGSETVKTSYPAYWQICIECNKKEWQEPKECREGHMTYVNTRIGTIKSFKSF